MVSKELRDCTNVRQAWTDLRDADMSEQLVELFIFTNSDLQVTGRDAGLVVVESSVSGELD